MTIPCVAGKELVRTQKTTLTVLPVSVKSREQIVGHLSWGLSSLALSVLPLYIILTFQLALSEPSFLSLHRSA